MPNQLELYSGTSLPNHQLALDVWKIGQAIEVFSRQRDIPINKQLDNFLLFVRPKIDRVSQLSIPATHQTSQARFESILKTGVIAPSLKNGSQLAPFSGVSLGLFGCYHRWVDEGKTFVFDLPLRHIYPTFVNTALPRVAAQYPGSISINDVPPINKDKYFIHWDSTDARQREVLPDLSRQYFFKTIVLM